MLAKSKMKIVLNSFRFLGRVTKLFRVKQKMALPSAVCPGGEGAVLKTVGLKRLASSNPVYGVILIST